MTRENLIDLMGSVQWSQFEDVANATPKTFGALVSGNCAHALTVLAAHGFDSASIRDRIHELGTDKFLVTAALASAEFVRARPRLPVQAELARDLLFALCRLAYADGDTAPDERTRVARLMTAAMSVGVYQAMLVVAEQKGFDQIAERQIEYEKRQRSARRARAEREPWVERERESARDACRRALAGGQAFREWALVYMQSQGIPQSTLYSWTRDLNPRRR